MQSDLIVTDYPVDGVGQPKSFSGKVYRAWACGSEGERLTGSQKVGGSSPPRSITMKDYEGSRIWKPSDFLEMSVQRASDSSVLYDAVTDFVTTKRLEQKSARTVGNYHYDLKTFLQVVGAQTPMANISPQQMVKQYLLLSQQRPGGPYAHFSRRSSHW